MNDVKSLKDQCKIVFLEIHELLYNKKINEATDYIASLIDNTELDDLSKINLLQSALVITRDYPNENLQNVRKQAMELQKKLLAKED